MVNVGKYSLHGFYGVCFSHLSCTSQIYQISFSDFFSSMPCEWLLHLQYEPLDPKTMKKCRFSTHKIWVITPKNEGYGFPRSTQRSCLGIRRSPKMCQVSLKKPLADIPLNPDWFIGILILASEIIPI